MTRQVPRKKPAAKPAPPAAAAAAAPTAVPPSSPDTPAEKLTPEEQMERFAKELKNEDWGHQPC